jgi:hypothetical protein
VSGAKPDKAFSRVWHRSISAAWEKFLRDDFFYFQIIL